MKSVKELNEKEKMRYYQCGHQTLYIVVFEVVIAVLVKMIFSLSDLVQEIGLLVMIMIPVLFYRIRLSGICKVEKEDFIMNTFLALMMSVYFFGAYGNSIYSYIIAICFWGVALYTGYLWLKQRNK